MLYLRNIIDFQGQRKLRISSNNSVVYCECFAVKKSTLAVASSNSLDVIVRLKLIIIENGCSVSAALVLLAIAVQTCRVIYAAPRYPVKSWSRRAGSSMIRCAVHYRLVSGRCIVSTSSRKASRCVACWRWHVLLRHCLARQLLVGRQMSPVVRRYLSRLLLLVLPVMSYLLDRFAG